MPTSLSSLSSVCLNSPANSFFLGVAITIVILLLCITLFEPIGDLLLGPQYPSFKQGHGIVVVTGSSSGIGLDTSISLATKGFYVYACVRKEQDFKKIEEIRKDMNKGKEKGKGQSLINIYPLMLDVTKHDTIQAAYKIVAEKCRVTGLPFAGLINNAGVSFSNPAEYSEESDIRWLMETNFFGVAFTTKEFLPLIRKDKGRIIIVGSVLGIVAQPAFSFYSASKFAVRGYAESLRLEMQMHGVSVSLIEPGYIRTKIIEKTLENVNQHMEENEALSTDYPRLYSEATIQMRKQEMEYSSDTSVSSKVISHAMMSSRPLTRYPISNIGILSVSLVSNLRRLFSDRALDWYTLKFKYPEVKINQKDKVVQKMGEIRENEINEETKTMK